MADTAESSGKERLRGVLMTKSFQQQGDGGEKYAVKKRKTSAENCF